MAKSVVVIGNFDGVHQGHQALLAKAKKIATLHSTEEKMHVIVVTFWPHPASVLPKSKPPKLINNLSQRITALRATGADEVRVVQFTKELASWTPQQFITQILLPLNPAVVVVGENFRFGAKASGDVKILQQLGRDDFAVEILDLASINDQPTCSTLVRQALAAGDVHQAAQHLGHWFSVTDVVVVGDQRGRKLGFPTANMLICNSMVIPADGVYAGWLKPTNSDDQAMPAAISVGTNPTFDGVQRRIESYVLDRDDLELYGVEVKVDFVARIRGQVKFDSIADLVAQMNDDVAKVRQVLANASS